MDKVEGVKLDNIKKHFTDTTAHQFVTSNTMAHQFVNTYPKIGILKVF